jgi:Ca2+-binding EF-hand superfamily protein
MTSKMKDKNSESDLIKAFKIIDKDNSESIDKKEFEFVF